MKLNSKGFNKLLDWAFKCKKDNAFLGNGKPEFEPDDFVDCVVLTIEEAKKVANAYEDLASISRVLLCPDNESIFLTARNELLRRVKKAEGEK